MVEPNVFPSAKTDWIDGQGFKQTGQATIDIDGLKAELAALRAERDRLRGQNAAIRAECAERAVEWLETLHHEPEPGLPWSDRIRRMQELQKKKLRAALKGEA